MSLPGYDVYFICHTDRICDEVYFITMIETSVSFVFAFKANLKSVPSES